MKKSNKKIIWIILISLISIVAVTGIVWNMTSQSGIPSGYPSVYVYVDEQEASQHLDKIFGFKAEVSSIGVITEDCDKSPILTVQGQPYSISIRKYQNESHQEVTIGEAQLEESSQVIEEIIDFSKFKDGISYSVDTGCAGQTTLNNIKFRMWVECSKNSHCTDVTTLTSGTCELVEHKCINKYYVWTGIPTEGKEGKEGIAKYYPIAFVILLIIFIILLVIYILRRRR